MNWFEKIFGFRETPQSITDNISISENILFSNATEKEYVFGKLTTPSLKELRNKIPSENGSIKLSEIIGNAGEIHKRPENKNALFQVASQFNLLEMIDPGVTPEKGITIYQNDRTQGPSCAMACPAGTLYRNYFTNINTLSKIESLFDKSFWRMQNGYALFEKEDLQELNTLIPEYRELIIENLQIGIQWDTEVNSTDHLVSQVYCSAIPVAYHYNIKPYLFDVISSTILDATYEAAFIAAIINKESNKLFLTLVGGGAFGNDKESIFSAIERSIKKFKNFDLDITLITYSYGYNVDFQGLIQKYS